MESIKKNVYVVDDDEAVRLALTRSLHQRGYNVETFESAQGFLDSYQEMSRGCLILDVRMPEISGLELQETLNERNISLPVIFITGHGDIPMSVRAIKQGAVDFLEKPYPVELLVERIEAALEIGAKMFESAMQSQVVKSCYESLTPREHDVMVLLVAGAADTSNKVIGRKLNISHRTVDDHCARVMAKMRARSLAELVEMAKICDVYEPV